MAPNLKSTPFVIHKPSNCFLPVPNRASHSSTPAEADGHLCALHDDRNRAPASAGFEHFVQPGAVPVNLVIIDRVSPTGVIVASVCGVGSGVLAVDDDLFGHGKLPAVYLFLLLIFEIITRDKSLNSAPGSIILGPTTSAASPSTPAHQPPKPA